MKKIIFAAIISAVLCSCYEDKSTYATNKIDDVVLNIADADKTIRIGYLEQLDIVPQLTKGGKALGDEGFTYLWEMNILPRNNEFEVLGTEPELHALMNNPISTQNYILKLTVHDQAEELDYLFTWDVYVETAFLDGLVVSDTRDGKTSDLTLILNNRLTMNYSKDEVIYRNIIETAGGAPYPSLLTSLTPFLFGALYGTHTNYLFAIDSSERLVRFDCQDYSSTDGKDLVYYYDGETVKGLFSVGVNVSVCTHFLLTSEGVYYCDQNGSNFVTPTNATLSVSTPKDNVFAFRTFDTSDYWYGERSAAWIDENDGAIKILDAEYMGGYYTELTETENSPFTAGDLGVQKVLAAGMTGGDITPTFLVKEASGDYAIYTVATMVIKEWDDYWEEFYEYTVPCPGSRIEVPAAVASRISSAVKTEFTDENSILYIASANEVSAVLYGSGSITDGGTKFTPDAGEQITSVKVYRQGDYYYSSGLFQPGYEEYNRPRLDLTSRALIVTTQSGNEGFVYVVPMTQLGSGNLDRGSAMKFSGFGTILDVATTGY